MISFQTSYFFCYICQVAYSCKNRKLRTLPLSRRTPISRALACFPKLYYYVPPLPNRIPVGEESVYVKNPRDAILWLLETLANDAKKPYCQQAQLLDLIQRWYPGMTPARFSAITRDLEKKGFITKAHSSGKDNRPKQLALTKSGGDVLDAIKAHRRASVVEFLFQGLNNKRQEALAVSLERVAARFWPKIKEAIDSESEDSKSSTPKKRR